MTDYAIPITWPNYPIATGSGAVRGLGHAGVVIVDGSTGQTSYFDYGRYRDTDGDGINDGWVRGPETISVQNLAIIDGRIDGASLQSMVINLNERVAYGESALKMSTTRRSTLIVYGRHAMREARLAAARGGQHGLQIMSFEQAAVRLAGGFARVLHEESQ